MKVIAVLSEKGGAGKTTLATNLARALQRRDGSRVCVLDTDPQGTSQRWSAAQSDVDMPIATGLEAKALRRALPSLAGAFDYAIIDGAPRLDQVDAIEAADVVLIPVQPSAADVWAAEGLSRLVTRYARSGRPRGAFVVSRQIQHTALARDVETALSDLDLPVFAHRTSQRVAYAEALSAGVSVYELTDSKAAAEIDGITRETLEFLHG